MKRFFQSVIVILFRAAFWLRYRVKVVGLEKLNEKTLNRPGGILVLPNHPTVLIDPAMVTIALYPKIQVRPVIVEYMYFTPGVNWVMRLINALPVPNFSNSSNSIKRRRNEKVVQTMMSDLRKGESFLIYPAGKTKSSSYEAIGGASAVHRIVQDVPEVNIVLVRTKGLWGSSFSRAFTGFAPPLFPTLKEGIKTVFKNLIFFTPRREVIIEVEPAPADFPYHASRLEFNKYLEAWYNKPDGLTDQKGKTPGDSFVLVSYSMWGEKYPEMTREQKNEETIDLEKIPQNVKERVIYKLAEMTKMEPESIKNDMDLASDLGLDSLDTAEITIFLQEEFDVKAVPVYELTTVQKLMALAAKQLTFAEEKEEEIDISSKWPRPANAAHKRSRVADGKTTPEVFLNICKQMGKASACGDMRSGVLNYSELKVRVLLLAEYIRTLEGHHIGILLPASVGAMILTLAVQMAGKIPLMINWTVGPRHLQSVVELSDVKHILSSWAFLDRLENVEFSSIEDKLLLLEELKPHFGLKQKLKALALSKRSNQHILRHFGVDGLSEEDKAVLLFTSGTESLPKGVPLTHQNILSNLRSALSGIEVFQDDVLLGILPPFHAFGFTASGLLCLLSGTRVAYSPDPTDGKKLAKAVEFWKATVICGAPTFLKNMIKAGKPEELSSLRLLVSGAEKAPPELFELVASIGKKGCLYEGYGITECSPFICCNVKEIEHKGVGPALPGIELCVIHPETEEVLPINTQGLVLTRGPNVFSGYLNPGLASPFIEIDGKTWYKTGDLGVVDEMGRLILSGRLKRFIKIGGEMVSLAAIEDALLQAASKKGWPTAEEGPSLAITATETDGDKPKIYLFSKFSTTTEQVNQALKEAGFSNLVRISACYQLTNIPLMGSGKINYRLLETDYLQKQQTA